VSEFTLRLGIVPRGEAGAFIAEHQTALVAKLPRNTNGGGLSCTHSGRCGAYALRESVRQMRGTAPWARSLAPDLGLPPRRWRVRAIDSEIAWAGGAT
jgi:acetyl-CoA acetyltransferase